MSRKNPKAGMGPCPNRHCNASVFFRQSPTGKLAYTCDHCDSSGYADQNGEAHKKWLSSVTKPADPAPEPTPGTKPDPTPQDTPKPAKKPANSVFDLANL